MFAPRCTPRRRRSGRRQLAPSGRLTRTRHRPHHPRRSAARLPFTTLDPVAPFPDKLRAIKATGAPTRYRPWEDPRCREDPRCTCGSTPTEPLDGRSRTPSSCTGSTWTLSTRDFATLGSVPVWDVAGSLNTPQAVLGSSAEPPAGPHPTGSSQRSLVTSTVTLLHGCRCAATGVGDHRLLPASALDFDFRR